jgi:two-component system NtrC family sensor kinase
MPGMNGIEFLREVREHWPDTIRIVLSGFADTASMVEAINEGQIYKFIPKPWNDEELKIAILNALERYSLAKKNKELTEELKQQFIKLENLLHEKNENLELRAGMLTAHQNILDAIPVGIVGIDLYNTIMQCNSKWRDISGDTPGISNKAERSLPEHLLRLVSEVKQKGRATDKFEINGSMCYVLGNHMAIKKQEGIILSVIRENDLLQSISFG